MLSGISFGIRSGIRGYCVFSLSLWHSILPRRLWSRSGGHHSDPGFAVEVRRGEEDKKEERSGWHRISQPGTCRWRDNTNKVKEAHGSTIQAAQSLSAMVFYSIKGHGHAVWSSKDSKNEWTEIITTSPCGLNPCLLLPPKLQVSVQSQKSDSWALSCKVEVSSSHHMLIVVHIQCKAKTILLTSQCLFLHQGSGLAGPRVFRSAFYRLYLLAFCLASVASKSFPVFILAIQQICSNIFWHKLT